MNHAEKNTEGRKQYPYVQTINPPTHTSTKKQTTMKKIVFNIIDVSFDCAVIAGFLIGSWNTLAPKDWCWLDTTISLLTWFVSTVFLLMMGLGYCIHEQEKEEAEKHKAKK